MSVRVATPPEHRRGRRLAQTMRSEPVRTMTRIAIFTALSAALTACAPADQRTPGAVGEANKTTAGTAVGAVGGGLLGAQIGHGSGQLAATAARTLLGAFI